MIRCWWVLFCFSLLCYVVRWVFLSCGLDLVPLRLCAMNDFSRCGPGLLTRTCTSAVSCIQASFLTVTWCYVPFTHSLIHAACGGRLAETQDQGPESYPGGTGDPGLESAASGGSLEAAAEGGCLGAAFLDLAGRLGPTAPTGSEAHYRAKPLGGQRAGWLRDQA